MIMMRPNPATKLGGKPPPPVPPRPSKTLVQEALAKTRKVSSTPIRVAPPPPNDLAKSKSSVNIILKKPVSYERSISEDLKGGNDRPIVYMSSNVKTTTVTATTNKTNSNDVVMMNNSDDTNSIEKCDVKSGDNESSASASSSNSNSLDKKWDKILNDRNHVNTLIDEMFASVLEVSGLEDDNNSITVNNETTTQIKINEAQVDGQPKTVIVIKDENRKNEAHEIKDKLNHELLITELQNMKMDQERILRRQRKPSLTIYQEQKPPETVDIIDDKDSEVSKIHCSDWVEVGDGGKEVHLSSCQITIEDFKKSSKDNAATLDCERISKMSSLHGLPPLPKSLSGFNILDNQQVSGDNKPPTPVRSSSIRSGQSGQHSHLAYSPKSNSSQDSIGRNHSNLDSQLAILRREMYSLRQLDLSLLSQLWSLNESIQDFRHILQDQDDRILLPPSPSPTNSSGDEGDGDEFYVAPATTASSRSLRPAPPPPPVRRPSNSSNGSSLG